MVKKQVGNACRTKNQIRHSKNRGSQFEMDCKYSLKFIYPDLRRMGCEGFQCQYDLRSDEHEVVFECKRLKGVSWNQLEGYYNKLILKKPITHRGYLLFKSNRQPCLVMYREGLQPVIKRFEDVFNTAFLKHPSTRATK